MNLDQLVPPQALFRQQAIDFNRAQQQWGAPVPLQGVASKTLSWTFCAAFAAIVVFLCLAPYARRETVVGYLRPVAGTAKVFAPRPGTITSVTVKQGQTVRQGDPLFTVSTSQISGNGENVQQIILDTLDSQKRLLLQQVTAEKNRGEAERTRLTDQIRSQQSELAQLQAQATLQSQRIALSNEVVQMAGELRSKGYVSEWDYKNRQQMALEQQQTLSSLQQQITKLQNDIIATGYTIAQLPTATGEKVQLLANELSATEQRMAETRGQSAYVVHAPVTGRIALLQAINGQAADPHTLQLAIVPADSPLEAELLVPTRAIGFIHSGQAVRIRYDAFPYQNFGTFDGTVITVSQSVLTSTDSTVPTPPREPVYTVTAALATQQVKMKETAVPLEPDMQLKADIILEQRSLMHWLLAPLRGAAY